MKNWSKLFVSLLALNLAAGCNVDDIEGPDSGINVKDGDNVYMSVTVALPMGGGATKSETSDPDNGYSSTGEEEVGKDYENTIARMLIVLARKSDNGYITYGTVDTNLDQSGTTVRATSKIAKTALATYYSSASYFSRDINVFVICNYTEDILDKFKASYTIGNTSWIDEICEVTESVNGTGTNTEIWAKGNMLMSNAVIASKILPATWADWDAYSSDKNPLDLSIGSITSSGDYLDNSGNIRVERSVARFDFRDASELTDNTYHVVATEQGDDKIDIVDIRLNRMALVNMSNKFYYFRRVTDAGTVKGGVCLPELPWSGNRTGNYVVDVDYDTKVHGAAAYNFPLFAAGDVINEAARGQWYTSLIDDVLEKGDDDQYIPDDKTYKIWRYATENTVNSVDRMISGLSTGIVFKGKMIPTDAALNSADEDIRTLAKVLAYDKSDPSLGLSENTNTDPILYTFGGNLYQRWTNVVKAAIAAATTVDGELVTTNSFYKAVFGNGTHEGEGQDMTSPNWLWNRWQETKSDSDLAAFKTAATGNGITLYQSSNDEKDGWGYYCYYFYWNRHNDNTNAGVIGPMEFAVVRNNVYKLAVTKINRLGHPRISENDPDPVDPEDPDETSDVYLSVAVEVLPWVVRENNIEF